MKFSSDSNVQRLASETLFPLSRFLCYSKAFSSYLAVLPRSFRCDKRVIESELRKTAAEKNKADAISKSDLARFGVEMPAILNIIESNADKFRKKPVGPIG